MKTCMDEGDTSLISNLVNKYYIILLFSTYKVRIVSSLFILLVERENENNKPSITFVLRSKFS